MQQKKIFTGLVILIIIGSLGTVIATSNLFSQQDNNVVDSDSISDEETSQLISEDEDVRSEDKEAQKNAHINIYSSLTCPHCKDVEQWIEEKQADEILVLNIKELSQNPEYNQELMQAADICGIDSNRIGIPFLYVQGECFVGKVEIIDYLQEEVDSRQQEEEEETEKERESSNEEADDAHESALTDN